MHHPATTLLHPASGSNSLFLPACLQHYTFVVCRQAYILQRASPWFCCAARMAASRTTASTLLLLVVAAAITGARNCRACVFSCLPPPLAVLPRDGRIMPQCPIHMAPAVASVRACVPSVPRFFMNRRLLHSSPRCSSSGCYMH